ESRSLETVGDASGPVAEAEHATLERLLRGDERELVAVDLSFVIRELERERGVRRVERGDAGGDATAPEPQAVPGGLGPHAHDHPAERERVDPLAAVRVLVVDETVAVVVHAVTADLGGVAGYAADTVAGRTARAGAAGAGSPVVARAARAGSRT